MWGKCGNKIFVNHLQKTYYHDNQVHHQNPGRPLRARSTNTVNGMLKKIRTLLNWCVSKGYLDKSPFDNYHIGGELYGTPVSMTMNAIAREIIRPVKDPALVASLTGHHEGSRAFSRYRAIDTTVKKELVKILEK